MDRWILVDRRIRVDSIPHSTNRNIRLARQMCKLRGGGNSQGVTTTSRDGGNPQAATTAAAQTSTTSYAAANTSSPTRDAMTTTTCFRTSCLWVNCSRFRTYFATSTAAAAHEGINLDVDDDDDDVDPCSLAFAQDAKRYSLHDQWLIKTCGVPRRR